MGIRSITSGILRWTYTPAALAFCVIVAVGFYAESLNRKAYEQTQRTAVLNQISTVRAKIEGKINGNLQLLRGLVAAISIEPGMTQARFERLAREMLSHNSPIRSIAGAPDMIVSLVYPVKGNERVIGLNYLTNEKQLPAVLRARNTGQLVLAGPVDLVQGGRGFIGRFPVFYTDDRGDQTFWGLVSAVIDVEVLYRESGLLDDDLPIEVSLRGRDALGWHGENFYGRTDLSDEKPVLAEISLPSGSWQLAAVPKGGWTAVPPNSWTLRLLILVAGGLIMVPTVMTGGLITERLRNIAEISRRERDLNRLSRRLGLALDASKIGVWEMNLENRNLYWDDRMNELYGYPADGRPRDYAAWVHRLHPDDAARAEDDFSHALTTRQHYNSVYRLVLPGGDTRHIRAIGTVYHDAGEPARMVGVNWDVSADVMRNDELKRATVLTAARNADLEAAKARIEFNALHDSLTNLPNRRYLDEVMARHAEEFADGERAGLLHIDLDRFKQINDTLGHAAGDAMLVHAAKVLKQNVRRGDFVARVGGDEFVILCAADGIGESDWNAEIATLAARIIDEMHQPVAYEGHECRFGVSIGIASDLGDGADPSRLLINADIALYRAKSRGRNRYQFFNEALQAEIVTTKRVADDILSGLERNEFTCHYQPQFDATTHEVIGIEALARWSHPTEGLLTPAAFMKTAEELNVVATIDRVVLEQTLRDLAAWAANGVTIPKASVNVSARRLHDEELVRTLRDLNIKPGTISFELVESIFLDENDELVTWNVNQIKELGIDIEIDDFGTGYASIVSLLKLQPRRLKIDRQLTTPVVRSAGQRRLVGSIIEIGRSLGIEVLAEGVETMAHAKVLQSLGCEALQGYAFARPMSGDDLFRFIQDRLLRKAS